MNNQKLEHLERLVQKTLQAKAGGFHALSTGEKLAAAILLNRFDWLQEMDYSMADAIERIDYDWLELIGTASRILKYPNDYPAIFS
ncbi:hypothetical protein [Paraburkholderia tropica]|uniref:hypothetical protein n=1 Tax=Paraburkholderia tropica TaxID=92647 RepID=UPI001ABCA6C0|nr:hypothetical protein [Paraburkholderia tropica]